MTSQLLSFPHSPSAVNENWRLPAEWEEQDCVQLTWPHAGTDWAPYLKEITATFIAMARTITDHERLIVVTPHAAGLDRMLYDRLGAWAYGRTVIVEAPTNDTWARDHAPLTLVSTDEGHPDFRLLDFCFNGWGEKFAADFDNAINSRLFAAGLFNGQPESHSDFVLEGGSVESDGHGTVFTTSCCLLAPHRNQPLDRAQLDNRLRSMLRARRIVWLDHGELIGDDTDGHIDTLVRIAPADTLLYDACTDSLDPQFDGLKALEAQLRTLRTLDGKPYQLVPLPLPESLYDGSDRLPATYANFLVINGAVLCPTYGQPANDSRALELLGEVFPGRDIIGIDSCTAVRQHGSLHCLSMQYPRGVLR